MERWDWTWKQPYRALDPFFYRDSEPSSVSAPTVEWLNESLIRSYDWPLEQLASSEGTRLLAGNAFGSMLQPYAQAYMGHQFGHLTMLGDGRAVTLGAVETPFGWKEWQWKGSGRTPFSRGGDGRGALGPMIREAIMSEAMHAFGIPTTRTLAVVQTGEEVHRGVPLAGGLIVRLATSHVRVGTFEYAYHYGSDERVKELANWMMQQYDSDLLGKPEVALFQFLERTLERQATLIAQWQGVGFIHGVMNTDNASIVGETIDYGPCAFMDVYDPDTVFSSIDHQGRYRYRNQPAIGGWNMARLLETFIPLLGATDEEGVEEAQRIASMYERFYERAWLKTFGHKIGIEATEDNRPLIEALLQLMETHKLDFTNTFRALTEQEFEEAAFEMPAFQEWKRQWLARIGEQVEQAVARMKQVNPVVIPRNSYVEEAIDEAVRGNWEDVERWLEIVREPYTKTTLNEPYRSAPHDEEPFVTYCGT